LKKRRYGSGPQIIDFAGLYLLHDAYEVGGIGQITIVQNEFPIRFMGVLVEMIDTPGVETRRSALDAVNLVAFLEKKFGQIGAILPRDTSNQCHFVSLLALFDLSYPLMLIFMTVGTLPPCRVVLTQPGEDFSTL
jgi:hypothetical protein